MYEAPEIFELGDADELTLGSPSGTWSDGLPHRWIRFSLDDEVPVDPESAEG